MTSDNCSKLMCRSAIFFQIEKGCFSPPQDLGLEAIVGEIELKAKADAADEVAAADLVSCFRRRVIEA